MAFEKTHSNIHRLFLAPSLVALVLALTWGCGGTNVNREAELSRLRQAIEQPVDSREQSAELSRTVESVLDADVLQDMTRAQVLEAIGRGDPCSRHRTCADNGFEDDDFFYSVGMMGDGASGALPEFIVGFDHTGRVVRTWNLTIGE